MTKNKKLVTRIMGRVQITNTQDYYRGTIKDGYLYIASSGHHMLEIDHVEYVNSEYWVYTKKGVLGITKWCCPAYGPIYGRK